MFHDTAGRRCWKLVLRVAKEKGSNGKFSSRYGGVIGRDHYGLDMRCGEKGETESNSSPMQLVFSPGLVMFLCLNSKCNSCLPIGDHIVGK